MMNKVYIDDLARASALLRHSYYDWDSFRKKWSVFEDNIEIVSKSPRDLSVPSGDQSSETRNRFDDELRSRPIEVASFENIKRNIGDVLIIKYDIENCSSDTIHEFSERLRQIYPGKKIFIIPSSCDLVYMGKEQLIELRDSLNKLIDASDYDSLL